MKKVLVILGPTATGKTDVGLILAKKFNGEIIACDSRQVYKGLDLGTGKLPGNDVVYKKGQRFWIIEGVKVWMYDIVNPKTQYTVKEYTQDAKKILQQILKIKKLPIIVGGTGFYLKGLLEGLDKLHIPTDIKLRKKLQKLALEQLQNRLQSLFPTLWETLNNSERSNKRRLIRKIELLSMNPYIDNTQITNNKLEKYEILKIGLTAPSPILNKRINQRVFSWILNGLFEEVKNLTDKGLTLTRLKELGLDYGLVGEYLITNHLNKEELINQMQVKTRQYAKRQLTWFKKDNEIKWFDITKKNWQAKVEKLASDWYNQN